MAVTDEFLSQLRSGSDADKARVLEGARRVSSLGWEAGLAATLEAYRAVISLTL